MTKTGRAQGVRAQTPVKLRYATGRHRTPSGYLAPRAAVLTVPHPLMQYLRVGARYWCELTKDGILFRPIGTYDDSVPSWLLSAREENP